MLSEERVGQVRLVSCLSLFQSIGNSILKPSTTGIHWNTEVKGEKKQETLLQDIYNNRSKRQNLSDRSNHTVSGKLY